MREQLLVLAVVLGSTLSFECVPDLTLSWAIDKRAKQIKAECHDIKAKDGVCVASDIDAKWADFVKVNDEYVKAVTECVRETGSKSRVRRHHTNPRDHIMGDPKDLPDKAHAKPQNRAKRGNDDDDDYDEYSRVRREVKDHDPNDGGDHTGHQHRRRRQEKEHDPNDGGDHTGHNHRRRRQEKEHDPNDGGDHTGHNHRARRQEKEHDPNDGGDHTGHNHRARRQEKDHDPNDGGDHSGHNRRRRRQEKEHDPNDGGDHTGHNHRRRDINEEPPPPRQNRRGTEAQCIAQGNGELKNLENKLNDHCKVDNFCDFDLLPDTKATAFKNLRKDRLKKYRDFYGAAALCHGKLE